MSRLESLVRGLQGVNEELVGPEDMTKAFCWVAIEGWAIFLHGIGSLHNTDYIRVRIHELRCRSGSLYSMSVLVNHVHNQKIRRVLSCCRVLCSTVGVT